MAKFSFEQLSKFLPEEMRDLFKKIEASKDIDQITRNEFLQKFQEAAITQKYDFKFGEDVTDRLELFGPHKALLRREGDRYFYPFFEGGSAFRPRPGDPGVLGGNQQFPRFYDVLSGVDLKGLGSLMEEFQKAESREGIYGERKRGEEFRTEVTQTPQRFGLQTRSPSLLSGRPSLLEF